MAQKQVFFYTILVAVSVAAFWLVSSYLDVIAFALVMVIILKPVYGFFLRWCGRRAGLATALTIITFFVVLVAPGYFVIRITTNQIAGLITDLSAGAGELSLDEIAAQINAYAAETPFFQKIQLTEAQQANIQDAIGAALLWTAQSLIALGMSVPALLARTFIFLGIVGALLPNYHEFVRRLIRLSPLDDVVDGIFLRKIKVTVWSMFVGIFVIAVVQGLLMGLFFWLGGVPYSAIWTLFAVIAAMLPLGASLVAIPIGIVELILGNPTAALLVLAGYFLVVSNADNLIRPRLVSKEAYLDFALLLLSALGGYELFGFFGVVYGPVLMILFMTTLDVYEEYYAPRQESITETSPSQQATDLKADEAGVS